MRSVLILAIPCAAAVAGAVLFLSTRPRHEPLSPTFSGAAMTKELRFPRTASLPPASTPASLSPSAPGTTASTKTVHPRETFASGAAASMDSGSRAVPAPPAPGPEEIVIRPPAARGQPPEILLPSGIRAPLALLGIAPAPSATVEAAADQIATDFVEEVTKSSEPGISRAPQAIRQGETAISPERWKRSTNVADGRFRAFYGDRAFILRGLDAYADGQ